MAAKVLAASSSATSVRTARCRPAARLFSWGRSQRLGLGLMFFCRVDRNSASLPDRCRLSGQPGFRPALVRSGDCPVTQAASRNWNDPLPDFPAGKPPQQVGEGSSLVGRHVDEGNAALIPEPPGLPGALLDPDDDAPDHLRGQG